MEAIVWIGGALVGAVLGALLGAAFVAMGMGALLVGALVLLALWAFFKVLAGVAKMVEGWRLSRLQAAAAAASLERQEKDARDREGWSR